MDNTFEQQKDFHTLPWTYALQIQINTFF